MRKQTQPAADSTDNNDTSTKTSSDGDEFLFGCVLFLVLIGISLSLFINAIVMAWHFLAKEIVPFLQYGPPINEVKVRDVAVFPLLNVLDWAAKHDWYVVSSLAQGVNTLPVALGSSICAVLFALTLAGIVKLYENGFT